MRDRKSQNAHLKKKQQLNFNNSQMLKVLFLAPALPQLLWCQELSAQKEAGKWTESCRLRGLFYTPVKGGLITPLPCDSYKAEVWWLQQISSRADSHSEGRINQIIWNYMLPRFFFRLLNLEDCWYSGLMLEQSLDFKAHHINMWRVQRKTEIYFQIKLCVFFL